MSEPYVGEIRMVGFNFAPLGWAFCNGQLLSIAQNEVLFTLIGTTYGGDGQSTFALPNLQGRLPVHQGNGYVQGEIAGTESVTLTTNQMPVHTHAAADQQRGNRISPTGASWAGTSQDAYSTSVSTVQLNPASVGTAGGNQPHDNLSPFQAINFIIALFGIFPSQN